MTSSEIFSTVARVVGQMALHMGSGRTTRAMIVAWADALERAASGLRRMAG